MGCCCSRNRPQPANPAAPEGYRPLRMPRGPGDGGGGDDDGGGGGGQRGDSVANNSDISKNDPPGFSDIPTAKPFKPPPLDTATSSPKKQQPQPALGLPVPLAQMYPQQPTQQPVPAYAPSPYLYPQVPFEDRAIKPYSGSTAPPEPKAPPRTKDLIDLLD